MKNKIQVLGSGCPTCEEFFELTKKAVRDLGLDTEVEYSNDIQKIIEMGVMQSPVLVINEKPVMTGSTSDIERIKQLIKNEPEKPVTKKSSNCGCQGGC